jgi:hypothetical protein
MTNQVICTSKLLLIPVLVFSDVIWQLSVVLRRSAFCSETQSLQNEGVRVEMALAATAHVGPKMINVPKESSVCGPRCP